MNWVLLLQIAYIILVILVILRVLYDTRSGTKTLAYILFVVFVPFVGMIFYFSFGINYRKRKLYSKKMLMDEPLRKSLTHKMDIYSETISKSGLIAERRATLVEFIRRSGNSPLTANNELKLLVNGEEKFPVLLEALEKATCHIHLEYYIYEDDLTGNQVAELLIRKAKAGVEVRFMYDDFGSHDLKKSFLKKLNDAGVQTAPFYKVKWYALANRLNYRNHRKIVIIDGSVGFVGGINMSDTYRNDLDEAKHLYWRDTHLMIHGQATAYLQYLFMADWNFCSTTPLEYAEGYFPDSTRQYAIGDEVLQFAASGPDSTQPVILYALLQAIASAKKRIHITSPYFIPGESMMDALIIAIKSGLDVKLIIPGVSDSKMVNTAASAYYTELLQYGAKIYKYNKGFVHAKTMVIDDDLAIIGSANMDYRSFDLNFEVNAMVYSKNMTAQLSEVFENDLKASVQIDAAAWGNRPKRVHLWEKVVRLLSPFL
ncbi:cardiolipin synthase [Subsaximicrobium wynnwilliamsii]|uniref:Cardiolipin synthase n=1 Tax=Subsaximicrobium wynnwilliamsii TaxID=291179 RepID=A0A5C6ZPG8_9FLAO|nr:cardiolipin synthase [Subsaximicrobium wynnwilliamsii]TXD84879.1 cardiolipin synthase [Subsaximicrobium wynnwilliamsii]TXD90550.1 cardiolipin synthase [Subsaximicrobium wynnwilliamsii]TXE05025.1 cardiolipin synthase [Subsaximicrobium wynnwilliamsii]